MRQAMRNDARERGLTLLELVVVLAILGTLGTVMITQTAGLTGEARYEQTVRTLDQVQDALIGRQPAPGEDPTAVAPGFVADIGRLPLAGGDLNLAELWDREASATPPTEFSVQALTGLDNDLSLACGWRGPYIRLPVGADELNDGWGRAFDLFDDAGNAVAADADEIALISSAGPGVGSVFDATFEILFRDTTVNRTNGDPVVQLEFDLPAAAAAGANFFVVVRLYGPIGGEARVIGQSAVLTFTKSAPAGTDDPNQTQQVTFTGMPIGPKLLRAYQLASSTAPGDEVGEAGADLTAQNKSIARRVTVQQGGGQWPNLLLEGQ